MSVIKKIESVVAQARLSSSDKYAGEKEAMQIFLYFREQGYDAKQIIIEALLLLGSQQQIDLDRFDKNQDRILTLLGKMDQVLDILQKREQHSEQISVAKQPEDQNQHIIELTGLLDMFDN